MERPTKGTYYKFKTLELHGKYDTKESDKIKPQDIAEYNEGKYFIDVLNQMNSSMLPLMYY